MTTVATRFVVGDRVLIKGGRGRLWTVKAVVHARHETEPGYALDNGERTRTATESVLTLQDGTRRDLSMDEHLSHCIDCRTGDREACPEAERLMRVESGESGT